MATLKPAGKLAIIALVVGGGFYGFYEYQSYRAVHRPAEPQVQETVQAAPAPERAPAAAPVAEASSPPPASTANQNALNNLLQSGKK